MKKIIVLMIAAALTASIATAAILTPPHVLLENMGLLFTSKPTDPREIEYGPKPTADDIEKELVKIYQKNAIDPTSVLVNLTNTDEEISIGILSTPEMSLYGWEIPHTFNAKNRMGGYVGAQEGVAYVREGKIMAVCETESQLTARIYEAVDQIQRGRFMTTPTRECRYLNKDLVIKYNGK